MRFVIGQDSAVLDAVTGEPKKSEIRRAKRIVNDNLESCRTAWRKYHG